ncbi:MAG TPA: deoxyribodipyrimidine photo-lyase [Accumulibacter sp.]|uniref:cryptochrome/photolyase family protein n=2 Tax=Accumulibacter sp. TaxID=2053492 RepID=UPI00287A484B|nr:deoxyribodipyrimidine photo-lyase [Accumulibacter sp.]MDS4055195.1 deoxyribodipyrimidine photo-lyase [Accumulibacter sp.]HMW62488.1 deoxyribodipyrimidine photo-lyase [Accumulibacter sp.]HMX67490.1 deoxyribodipyrimidine photo-lyase [Accumulibacter sp.]HNB66663.1 deoxyribodipyrimidine photo-lyase [Accumulibacter sp.]HND37460.1 deoxyribodipyrimidine photo-lyase [Accumulibacter sp.]
MFDSVLVWFRRDLRDTDHGALDEALRQARRVHCAFIFDREILDALPERADRRVEFIRDSLLELDQALRLRGGGLIVRHGWPREEIPRLAQELGVAAVFVNRDYEPLSKRRDAAVAATLRRAGIDFRSCKDQVVFDGEEILNRAGHPYTVFTPYRRAWLARLTEDRPPTPGQPPTGALAALPAADQVPTLHAIGFRSSDPGAPRLATGMSGAQALLDDFLGRIARYAEQRNFPASKGVSYLSVHLRFGTVSIRHLVLHAIAHGALLDPAGGAATWLGELIWRDFYFMILDHFPHVTESAFRPAYDAICWEQGTWADEAFAAWCTGCTGYPLVDAAMRQLNQTGYMHNRLRMLVASFLSKDLGLDWRRGEAYFASKLNDFDLAANNGGWQWAASTGCDAQPYFRIFNPLTQSERFDPAGKFIRRYLPELSEVPDRHLHAPWRMSQSEQAACATFVGDAIRQPLVDHETARQRTLARYSVVRNRAAP